MKWSGRKDLNLRPPGPEPGALARLRYAPTEPARPHQRLERNHNISIAAQHEPAGVNTAAEHLVAQRNLPSRQICGVLSPPESPKREVVRAFRALNVRTRSKSQFWAIL